jgi:fluoride exporter
VTAVLIGLGGAAGVLARYGLGTLVSPESLPWLTIGINIVGSFLLGFLVATAAWFPQEVRMGLAIGLLGGFTTFSTFSVDVFLALDKGEVGTAAALTAASVAFGVGAAAGGYFLGRLVR